MKNTLESKIAAALRRSGFKAATFDEDPDENRQTTLRSGFAIADGASKSLIVMHYTKGQGIRASAAERSANRAALTRMGAAMNSLGFATRLSTRGTFLSVKRSSAARTGPVSSRSIVRTFQRDIPKATTIGECEAMKLALRRAASDVKALQPATASRILADIEAREREIRAGIKSNGANATFAVVRPLGHTSRGKVLSMHRSPEAAGSTIQQERRALRRKHQGGDMPSIDRKVVHVTAGTQKGTVVALDRAAPVGRKANPRGFDVEVISRETLDRPDRNGDIYRYRVRVIEGGRKPRIIWVRGDDENMLHIPESIGPWQHRLAVVNAILDHSTRLKRKRNGYGESGAGAELVAYLYTTNERAKKALEKIRAAAEGYSTVDTVRRAIVPTMRAAGVAYGRDYGGTFSASDIVAASEQWARAYVDALAGAAHKANGGAHEHRNEMDGPEAGIEPDSVKVTSSKLQRDGVHRWRKVTLRFKNPRDPSGYVFVHVAARDGIGGGLVGEIPATNPAVRMAILEATDRACRGR